MERMEFPIRSTHGNEHTVSTEGTTYDVFVLIHEDRNIPIEEIDPNEIWRNTASEECWDDLNGKMIKPEDVMTVLIKYPDWEEAERKYPNFKKHIEKIKNSDYSHPIILSPEGILLDGTHRLVKACLEKVQKIPVRKFSQLPESAKYEDK